MADAAHPAQPGEMASASGNARRLANVFHPIASFGLFCILFFIYAFIPLFAIFALTKTRSGTFSLPAILARGITVLGPVLFFFIAGAQVERLISPEMGDLLFGLTALGVPLIALTGIVVHLRRFMRVGSQHRRRFDRVALLTAAAVVAPLLAAAFSSEAAVVTGTLSLLLWLGWLPWRAMKLVGALWTLETTPEQLAVRCAAWVRIQLPELTVHQQFGTLQIIGSVDGVNLRARLDFDRVPAQLIINVPANVLPADLQIHARTPADSRGTGVKLSDMLLSELLVVDVPAGVDADALLDGLHDDLLSVFHAHPESSLRHGWLSVQVNDLTQVTAPTPTIPGPSEEEQIEQRVAQHLVDAARIIRILKERLDESRSRQVGSENHRRTQTPQMITPR
ncbi:MAG: hypothetical protein AAFV53_09340 [Myxococcota bacterium]